MPCLNPLCSVCTNSPACAGCFTHANIYQQQQQQPFELNVKLTIPDLSDTEKEILQHLADAWGKFMELEPTHPSHAEDFTNAIHKLQYIMAMRLAQQCRPEIFPRKDNRGKTY